MVSMGRWASSKNPFFQETIQRQKFSASAFSCTRPQILVSKSRKQTAHKRTKIMHSQKVETIQYSVEKCGATKRRFYIPGNTIVLKRTKAWQMLQHGKALRTSYHPTRARQRGQCGTVLSPTMGKFLANKKVYQQFEEQEWVGTPDVTSTEILFGVMKSLWNQIALMSAVNATEAIFLFLFFMTRFLCLALKSVLGLTL